MDPVLDYIIDKGWEYRLSGDEVILKRCVFCGRETYKLSLNRKSRLFQCFRASCAEKGHISKLKRHVGDIIEIEGIPSKALKAKDFTEIVKECHIALLENSNIIKYLDDCGITLEAINKFSLGLRKYKKNLWLVYPSCVENKPVYLKYRILPFDKELSEEEKGKGLSKFLREKDVPSIMFNQDAIAEHDSIIVTEGEKDAISLLSRGIENVVGATGGADTLRPEWYELLKEKEKIFLCFDNDEAGHKGAKEKWASRLGYSKCFFVRLPEGIKDITDFFLEGHVVEDFNNLITNAAVFDVPGIRSVISILREMAEDTDPERIIPTKWSSINGLLGGGFRPGQLITLSAPPKIGKTSISLQLSSFLAAMLGVPVLFFCQEMTYNELVHLFVVYTQDRPWYEFSAKEALIASLEFEEIPMFLGYYPRITINQVRQTFLDVRERFGVEFFVFDNLHTLIREDRNVTERVGMASKMFKELAMEMQIPILLIAQPRKLERDQVMSYYDIRDSSSIPADSDIVCLMHRNRMPTDELGGKKATFSAETRFIVDASRWSAGGECRLMFDSTYRQFFEV